MYNDTSQSIFKRRKHQVDLKPVNPVQIKTCVFAKIFRSLSNRFRRKKVASNVQIADIDTAIIENGNQGSAKVFGEQKQESPDISALLREITADFFENDFQQFLVNKQSSCRLRKIKSESSLTSNEFRESNVDGLESCSDVNLRKTRQCVSATAFLTTSFLSFPTTQEYLAYSMHLNVQYAEKYSAAQTNNTCSQYSETDFTEQLNKDVKTSTRELADYNDIATQCIALKPNEFLQQSIARVMKLSNHMKTSTGGMTTHKDNVTQYESMHLNEFIQNMITQKVAHYFEFAPTNNNKGSPTHESPKKIISLSKETNTSMMQSHQEDKSPKKMIRISKETNTSTMQSHKKDELKILYTNNIRNFVSTDDTTVESKPGNESINNKVRRMKFRRPTNQIPTRNCSTNTSNTCIRTEMCPTFKEWYEFLQNVTENQGGKFRNLGILKNNASGKPENNKNSCYETTFCKTKPLITDREMHCDEDVKKLGEYSEDEELNAGIRFFIDKLKSYIDRNLIDILSRRYPAFIDFYFNNNQAQKVHYTLNKRPKPKSKIPKIIIKKREKSHDINSEDEESTPTKIEDNTSLINVTGKKPNVLEIGDIIDSVLSYKRNAAVKNKEGCFNILQLHARKSDVTVPRCSDASLNKMFV